MDYDRLVREALRGVVKLALEEIAAHGLEGRHHLYLTFRTDVVGGRIPARLRVRFPDVMTVVLRNQYWDLAVDGEAFSVTLSFGGVHERLTVPFAAVTAIVDPSVPFGLQFAKPTTAQDGAPGASFTSLPTGASLPMGGPRSTNESDPEDADAWISALAGADGSDAGARAPAEPATDAGGADADEGHAGGARDSSADEPGGAHADGRKGARTNVVRLTDFRKPRDP